MEGVCRLGMCRGGFVNLDRDADNGCECEVSGEICNDLDDDCNAVIDDGFALDHDPENCGTCNYRCELAHATSACVAGRCKIVGCEEGFSDFDRDASTGCEAARCDVVESIGPASGSSGRLLPVGCDLPQNNSGAPQGSCSDFARCSADADGTVDFEYQGCDAGGSSVTFATCELASSFDMTSFDEGSGGERVLEVRFSVTHAIQGSLNLWYGRHPLRKLLPLASAGSLTVGCHVARFFTGADARFPSWCGIPKSCTETCPTPDCGPAFLAQTQQWAGGYIDGTCFTDGVVPTKNLDQFALGHTPINLVAEWGNGECLEGKIHVDSIRLLAPSCRCLKDADCSGTPGRSACHDLADYACASDGTNGRGGVCGPPTAACAEPPQAGSPCQVTTNTGTYVGKIRCESGACVCAIE